MRQLITNIYRAIGRPVKEEENEDETVVSDSEWIEKANTLIEESKVVKQQVAKYQKTGKLTEEIT